MEASRPSTSRWYPWSSERITTGNVYNYTLCTVGWSDFSFLWNFERKQVGVVTFVKKHVFIKKNLINSKTETRPPLKGSHKKNFSIEFPFKKN